ncbi:MAG TPA: RDD family protein [Candidatus Competibacteraceae bacterium]|nr:RDD family protein [Candidatus Competibacteraceae bacterium]
MPETHPEPAGYPTLSPAKLPRRLAAIVYDELLLTAVLMVASALAWGLMAALLGSAAVAFNNPLRGNPFFQTYLLLVCFFFYGGFWVRGGQTLGMRAWRLRITRRDGRGIGWSQALLRFLTASLWLAPFYLHPLFQVSVATSIWIGLAVLLLLLALRLPDRVSETELVVLPRPGQAG